MMIKLETRDGKTIYLNTETVILAEETDPGWLITIKARVPAMASSGVVHRVLDLDKSGAAPLIQHLGNCAQYWRSP